MAQGEWGKVVRIWKVGEPNNLCAKVVPKSLLKSGELVKRMETEFDTQVKICVSILLCVAFLYNKNIKTIHRDIKSGNFVLKKKISRDDLDREVPEIAVCDLGFSKNDPDNQDDSERQNALGLGSGGYMVPEVRKDPHNSGKYDRRAGLFSVGVTFFAVCGGRLHPFCDFAPLLDDWEPTKHVGEMLKPQRDHLGNVNDPDMWRIKTAMIRLLQKKLQDRGSIVEVLQILGASPDQIAQAQEGPAGEAVPLRDVVPAEGVAPMAAPPVPQAPPGRTRSSAAAVSASTAASAPSRVPRADAQPHQFSKFTDSQSISQSSV